MASRALSSFNIFYLCDNRIKRIGKVGPRRPHSQTLQALVAVGFPGCLLDLAGAWLPLAVPPGQLL